MNRKEICYFIIVLLLALNPHLNAQYAEYDWEERDSWMPLSDLFELSGIREGHIVADIGCHEGYLSMHLAREVGKNGAVYAEDINKYRLEKLAKHARDRGIQNISTIEGDESDPRLPDGFFDIIYVVDAYHEMEDPVAMLRHFKKALRPGGRLVILEKLKKKVRGKSRRAQTDAHSLAPEIVREEVLKEGFEVIRISRKMGLWEENPNKEIWTLVAAKGGV